MEAKMPEDLQQIESVIHAEMRRFPLDRILYGLRQFRPLYRPFQIAAAAMFAMRFTTGGHKTKKIETAPLDYIDNLITLVSAHVLSDPIGFEPPLESRLLSVMLRIVGSQFPFSPPAFQQFARAHLLFNDIATDSEQFDFAGSFRKLTGVGIEEYLEIAFVAYIAASSHSIFTRDYFNKARDLGMGIPSDVQVASVLDHLAADPAKFCSKYEQCRQRDRRFGAFDFNPILVYPLLRPWRNRGVESAELDRFVAPIPDLILWRVTTGVYYELTTTYPAFSRFFGLVFEKYVGRILKAMNVSGQVLSEEDIRKTYPAKRGKAPDWIVIEGDEATFVECKVTHLSRLAMATGDEEAIRNSLRPIHVAMKQLHEFRDACVNNSQGLQAFHACKSIRCVILTMEPIYLSSSEPFNEFVDNFVGEPCRSLKRQFICVDQLEALQPHVATGIPFAEMIRDLENESFNYVLGRLHGKTKCVAGDSFLQAKTDELFKRLEAEAQRMRHVS